MKARVVWYNDVNGNGEAEAEDGSTILIYERSFKSVLPKPGDVIMVMKTKEFPGMGAYAALARVIRSKSFKVKSQKAA